MSESNPCFAGTQTAELGSRALFPTLIPKVYANHASLSPPSLAVRQAVERSLEGYATQGMAWYAEEVACRDRLRSRLAGLIGARAEDLALVANTSAGIVSVAQCLPWQSGDRVLLLEGEFPTNITPWQQAARCHGLELVWMKADDFRLDRPGALERLEDELRKGLRLLAVSAVQFTTGQRMPLETFGSLCRQYGSELFVDAIQATGIVPLDVSAMGIHYLSSGSHKWLMGPEGLGFLYAEPEAASRLRPNVAGWLSHQQPFAFLTEGSGHLRYDRPFAPGVRMVEAGTFNTLGAAGLEASVDLIEQLGVARVLAHVQAWHDAIESGLIERGFQSARMADQDGRSGSLCLRPPGGDAPALARSLAEHGISCASPDGWLRLSPSWPNRLDEPTVVLDSLDRIHP